MAADRKIEGVDVVKVRRRPLPKVVQERVKRMLPRAFQPAADEETGTVALARGYFTLERIRTASAAKVKAKQRAKLRGSR